MRLVHALQLADKDCELMIYPSSRHGIGGAHYQRIQIEFIRRMLLQPKPEPPKPRSPGEMAAPSQEDNRPADGRGRRRTAASAR
jgi:hypothetical protein